MIFLFPGPAGLGTCDIPAFGPATISTSITGTVFYELMQKKITESSGGRGGASPAQSERARWRISPSALDGGEFFLSFSPCFWSLTLGWRCSLPGQGVPPTHPAGPAPTVPKIRRFVSSTGRALADPRWQILSSLLNNSSPH